MKGSYLLLICLSEPHEIMIGKLGVISFKKGHYVYVGSALSSLEKRIQRHLRDDKKLFWHIDYLLKHGTVLEVFYKENSVREECHIACLFATTFLPIPGFGCSDCRCSSHLFFGDISRLQQTIHHLSMKTYKR